MMLNMNCYDSYFDQYEVIPLDTAQLEGNYQPWALNYFTNPELVPNPYLDITILLDISSTVVDWQQQIFQQGGTLTGWLVWNLLQALKTFTCFQWRYINGQWFEVKNPPLFSPIVVDKVDRFASLIIENPFKLSWPEFAFHWTESKQRLQRDGNFANNDTLVFGFSHFIGNLPHLYFTGLSLHYPTSFCQPFFYLGQRRCDGQGVTTMPLAAKLHHASADPYLFELLLQKYLQYLQPEN